MNPPQSEIKQALPENSTPSLPAGCRRVFIKNCPICLEPITDEGEPIPASCGHLIHKSCLLEALTKILRHVRNVENLYNFL